MQREEKLLESSLEALLLRVQEVKSNIAMFIMKLEHEYEILNWPTMLDNYALLSGQINSLYRLIKTDKMPNLRNQIMLPLALSPERDLELEKLTEGRVPAFNHEVVPDYLRTKQEPEVEDKVASLAMKANNTAQDVFHKQMNNINKIIHNITESIQNQREDTEREINQKTAPAQTSSLPDTNHLIAAISFGKGLKPIRPRMDLHSAAAMHQNNVQMQNHQAAVGGAVGQPPPGYQHPAAPGYYQAMSSHGRMRSLGGNVHMNKAQSNIKTNVRQANHPYNRL